GREGADAVKYKVCDNGVPVQCSLLATLTLNVSGMLWFVNSAAGAGGDGRLTSPFNTLAAFNTLNNGTGDNPAAADNIFLYTGSYTGPLTLLNNQKLIGQGASASLITISGLSLAADSAALPATALTAPTPTT